MSAPGCSETPVIPEPLVRNSDPNISRSSQNFHGQSRPIGVPILPARILQAIVGQVPLDLDRSTHRLPQIIKATLLSLRASSRIFYEPCTSALFRRWNYFNSERGNSILVSLLLRPDLLVRIKEICFWATTRIDYVSWTQNRRRDYSELFMAFLAAFDHVVGIDIATLGTFAPHSFLSVESAARRRFERKLMIEQNHLLSALQAIPLLGHQLKKVSININTSEEFLHQNQLLEEQQPGRWVFARCPNLQCLVLNFRGHREFTACINQFLNQIPDQSFINRIEIRSPDEYIASNAEPKTLDLSGFHTRLNAPMFVSRLRTVVIEGALLDSDDIRALIRTQELQHLELVRCYIDCDKIPSVIDARYRALLAAIVRHPTLESFYVSDRKGGEFGVFIEKRSH